MAAVLLVLLSIMAVKPVYAGQFMPVSLCRSVYAGQRMQAGNGRWWRNDDGAWVMDGKSRSRDRGGM